MSDIKTRIRVTEEWIRAFEDTLEHFDDNVKPGSDPRLAEVAKAGMKSLLEDLRNEAAELRGMEP